MEQQLQSERPHAVPQILLLYATRLAPGAVEVTPMSMIGIDGHFRGLESLESLALAVSTLSRAGVECHGVPISPGALYAMVEVQDRQANYALCVLKSTGFDVSPDPHPFTSTLSTGAR